jgi:hypothetical protein
MCLFRSPIGAGRLRPFDGLILELGSDVSKCVGKGEVVYLLWRSCGVREGGRCLGNTSSRRSWLGNCCC